MRAFLTKVDVWLKLGASEPFLVAVSLIAVLLSWGLILTDEDLFHLLWYDNAGAWYKADGSLMPNSLFSPNKWMLYGTGCAACVFWCIWVTMAYTCVRSQEESDAVRRRRPPPWPTFREFAYETVWLSIPAVLSFLPAVYSSAPEYEDTVLAIEDRWPLLVGAAMGGFLFWLAFHFTPRDVSRGAKLVVRQSSIDG